MLSGGPDEDPKPLGQHSAHFTFRRGYVELTSHTDPNLSSHLEALIRRYAGLHIVALDTDSADSIWRDLSMRGINPLAPVSELRRIVHGKRHGTAEFKWFRVPASLAPEGFFCVVEVLNPELIYQEEMLDHPNGALALSEVIVCVTDIADACSRFSSLLKVQARELPVGRAFAVGQERLIVVDEKELSTLYPGVTAPAADCLAGITVEVADLRDTRVLLEEAGVATSSAGADRIWVGPESARGVVLTFRAGA
jgi:hypothetical protein